MKWNRQKNKSWQSHYIDCVDIHCGLINRAFASTIPYGVSGARYISSGFTYH